MANIFTRREVDVINTRYRSLDSSTDFATFDEVGRVLGISRQRAQQLERRFFEKVEKLQPAREGVVPFIDLLFDDKNPNKYIGQKFLPGCYKPYFSLQQAEIMNMRYGLTNNSPQSFAEISNNLEISKEKVCKIDKGAFDRLTSFRREFAPTQLYRLFFRSIEDHVMERVYYWLVNSRWKRSAGGFLSDVEKSVVCYVALMYLPYRQMQIVLFMIRGICPAEIVYFMDIKKKYFYPYINRAKKKIIDYVG